MCLNPFLKAPINLHSVIDPDRAFHHPGVAILKARCPKPLSLLRGTDNWLETVQRNVRTLVLSWSVSVIYSGA